MKIINKICECCEINDKDIVNYYGSFRAKLCFNCKESIGKLGCCIHKIDKSSFLSNIEEINNLTKNLKRQEFKDKWEILSLKMEATNAYGGKCFHCEEKDSYFLTLYHVNNNFDLEKLTGFRFHNFLRDNGYPGKDIQLKVICYNCEQKHKSSNLGLTAEVYEKQEYINAKEKELICDNYSKIIIYNTLKNKKDILSNNKIMNCRVCDVILNLENTSASFLQREIKICRNCNQNDVKIRYANRRISIMEKLGNKCKCCGENNKDILSIDHIHGGGHKEAQEIKGKKYIKILNEMNDKDLHAKFQCLCFNCNYTKGFWNICPHSLSSDRILSTFEIDKKISLKTNHEQKIIYRRIDKIKSKLETLYAYGNECVSCKINHPMFLTLDHLNNNGSLENERGYGFYCYLKSFGYPGKSTQLQILCHNCNAKKEYEQRKSGNIIRSLVNEIYIKQNYSISKEQNQEFNDKAKILYYQMNKYKDLY